MTPDEARRQLLTALLVERFTPMPRRPTTSTRLADAVTDAEIHDALHQHDTRRGLRVVRGEEIA